KKGQVGFVAADLFLNGMAKDALHIVLGRDLLGIVRGRGNLPPLDGPVPEHLIAFRDFGIDRRHGAATVPVDPSKGFERVVDLLKGAQETLVCRFLIPEESPLIEDQRPGEDGEPKENEENNLRNKTEGGKQPKQT